MYKFCFWLAGFLEGKDTLPDCCDIKLIKEKLNKSLEEDFRPIAPLFPHQPWNQGLNDVLGDPVSIPSNTKPEVFPYIGDIQVTFGETVVPTNKKI